MMIDWLTKMILDGILNGPVHDRHGDAVHVLHGIVGVHGVPVHGLLLRLVFDEFVQLVLLIVDPDLKESWIA